MPYKRKQTKRTGYRKVYEQHHGVIPNGFHVHHIKPLYAGGTDDPDNLEALPWDQHAQRHLDLYITSGDFRDLCSYHLILNGQLDDEAQFAKSSAGGKIGGNIVKALAVGICTANTELRRMWASEAGKIGGVVQRDSGLGIHAQTREERLAFAAKGGPKNKGFRWYLNGDGQSRKYTTRQQQVEPFDDFIKRTGNRKGRT